MSGVKEGVVRVRKRIGPFTYTDTVLAEDSLENGKFHLRFRKKDTGYLNLEDPSEENLLYLRPGDSLYLQKGLHEKLHFQGEGAAPNRYIRDRKKFQDSLGRSNRSLFTEEKKAFLKALNAQKKAYRSFRKEKMKERGIPKDALFRKIERARDRIDLALIRFSYPDIYRYEHPNDSIKFSSSYWNFLDSLDLNDTLFLKVPEFLNFAYDVANKYTLENKGEQKSMSYREILFRTIQEEFKGRVKEVLLTYFILEQINYAKEEVRKELLKDYRKEVGDPFMKKYVREELKKSKKVKNGKREKKEGKAANKKGKSTL